MFLAASSSFKGKSDREKFDKARRLHKYIDKIRREYRHDLHSSDPLKKQRATATWVIDVLALRAGNEKDEDEADTVGCCSLRIEHVILEEPCLLTLDFLGKDSMQYHQTIDVNE